MKKLAIIPLLVLATVSPSFGANEDPADDFVKTGTLLAGNPANKSYAGISELGAACGQPNELAPEAGTALDNIDGTWVDVPDNAAGLDATLTANALPTPVVGSNDVDVWWYNDGCTLIRPSEETPSAYHMATSARNEFGVVPEGAAWAIVSLASGANATYTFTIYDVPPAEGGEEL